MTGIDRSRLPSVAPDGVFHFPHIHRDRLGNGLEVRAISHRSVPIVSAVLLVPGGFAADPADRPGLAGITADLLDEGSDGRDALGVADAIARVGGDLDVDLSADATTVGLTMLGRFLPQGLDLLAGIATRPVIADADVSRVRTLRLDRLRQLRDHAQAIADREFARALYGVHPYGHTGLGDEASLTATTIDEIRAFHARVFAPSTATLVIVGDASVDTLVAAAEKAFGGWRNAAPGADTASVRRAPQNAATRLTLVGRPGSAQSELRIGHPSVPRSTPDYHALLLLNTVLGGQFVSRINMNLRQDKGFTYGARTGFDLRRGPGYFSASTSVQSEVTAPAVTEVLKEIADIRGARPPSADELGLARASLTLGYPRGFETAQQVARGVTSLALHDLPDTYFEEFVPTVRAVPRDAVIQAAVKHLDPARLIGVIVGDVDRMGSAMTALGFGEPAVTSI
jgi:zinc protease